MARHALPLTAAKPLASDESRAAAISASQRVKLYHLRFRCGGPFGASASITHGWAGVRSLYLELRLRSRLCSLHRPDIATHGAHTRGQASGACSGQDGSEAVKGAGGAVVGPVQQLAFALWRQVMYRRLFLEYRRLLLLQRSLRHWLVAARGSALIWHVRGRCASYKYEECGCVVTNKRECVYLCVDLQCACLPWGSGQERHKE